jgi:hypothetical protein
MYYLTRGLAVLAFIALVVGLHYGEHKVRQAAQTNPTLFAIVQNVDAASFLTSGGDAFGYSNYFKWHYATWLKSPDRTLGERFMFWRTGWMYDASNPPAEYMYPPLFEQTS